MTTSPKLFLLLALAVFFAPAKAQDNQKQPMDFGLEIRNTAISLIPDLDIMNKILFINVWTSDDAESRDNNKEFARVSNIYSQAKLKNGSSGVVLVSIGIDPELHKWVMSVKKDEFVTKYSLENSSEKYNAIVKHFDGKPGNMVIGNDGTTIAKDIKKDDCFPLFRSFITR